MIQWTSVTTIYGQYGASVKNNPGESFILPKNLPPYELENLYREASRTKYDTMFRKTWTFDAFVFLSVFLALYAMKKDGREE
jgi:hypothetical protein